MIGREWTDSAVQHDLKYFPFKVVDKNSKPHITLTTSTGDQSFAAEEISAMVLVKMKETAEAYLGKKVTHAVVTVPAVSCNVDNLNFYASLNSNLPSFFPSHKMILV
jgi:heat shock protein 5